MDIKQWTFVHHLENLDYIFSSNLIIKHMSYAHIALAGVDRSSLGLWKPHWFGWIRGHLSVAHTQKDVQIANIWAVKWKEVQPKLEQTIPARSCSIICGSTFEASLEMKGRTKTCWMKRWRIDRDKRRRGKKRCREGRGRGIDWRGSEAHDIMKDREGGKTFDANCVGLEGRLGLCRLEQQRQLWSRHWKAGWQARTRTRTQRLIQYLLRKESIGTKVCFYATHNLPHRHTNACTHTVYGSSKSFSYDFMTWRQQQKRYMGHFSSQN